MKNLLKGKSVKTNENRIAQFAAVALTADKTQNIKGGSVNNGGISELILGQ